MPRSVLSEVDAGRTIIDLLQSDLRIMRKTVLRLLREHKGFRFLRRRGWHRGTRVRIHGATRLTKELTISTQAEKVR
jgi:hypothetical protein